MPRVAIIIPNWNGGELAVASAKSATALAHDTQLFVIDNGSKDGSGRAIAKECPEIELIENPQNLGFAAAVNQGLQVAKGFDYTLLLNNDVVFRTPGDLVAPLEYLEKNPSAHGVCGRYEYPDGSFQHFYNQLPTPFDLATYWGFGRHVPGLLGSASVRRFLCVDYDFSREGDIEQPAFACILCRSRALEAVGDLDPRLPIFFNDVDYCWRWRERGWTFRYLPEWRIVHHRSTSTSRLGAKVYAEMAGSISRFATKHFRASDAAAVRASLVAEATWRRLRHRDFDESLANVWRGGLVFLPDHVTTAKQ